jgi:predicted porin
MEDRTMKKNIFKYTMYSSMVAVIVFLGLPSVQALEVKLSGQVNRAVMWADNGNDTSVLNVDNDNSSTRFSLTGSEQVNDSVTVGVVWENEFQSNASNNVDVGQDDDGTSAFNDRKLEAYFVVPFGKISIGQGDGAANGTSEEDLSGTGVIMYSGVNDTAESLNFRDNDDTPIATVGSTRSNFDGLSRNDRLRYDTPTFGGATLSVSGTNGDAYELAVRYSADFDGIGKITTAIGYVDSNDRSDPEYTQIGGSVSWLHTSGINLTVSSGTRDIDNTSTDPVNYYGKLGYKFDIHAIAVEYGMTEDLAQDKDKSINYGLAYVIKPWNGVEFYGTYRTYELDRDGTSNIEDIRQVMLGTRVKF